MGIDTHMSTHMGSMNISIGQDVYDELKRRKAKGESFSDVLRRVLRQPGRLSDFAGVLADVPSSEWRRYEAERAERRRLELEVARRRGRRHG